MNGIEVLPLVKQGVVSSSGATQSNAPSVPQHLDFLDGMRAVASLTVVAGHYYIKVYHLGLPRWGDVLGFGYLGVHLFLMLSGFCVAWAYVGPSRRQFALGDFFYKRVTRIMPAYLAALAIATVIAAPDMGAAELFVQVLTHVAMVHNFSPATVHALSGPFWSLALECQLYVVFPLIVIGLRRIGVLRTLLAILAFQMAFRVYALRYGAGYNEYTFVLPWSVAGSILGFSFGTLAAIWVARGVPQGFSRRQLLALSGLGLITLLAARTLKVRLGITHPLTDLFWSTGLLMVLLCAAHPRHPLHALVSSRPLVKIGAFSYSLYLVHELTLGHITTLLLDVVGGRVNPIWLTPFAVGASCVVGYAFYRVVERPALEHFKRAASSRFSISPEPGAARA